jgi:hypothetical protein
MRIEYDPRAQKDLEGLDHSVQREIVDYMETRIAAAADPRQYGKCCGTANAGSGVIASEITGSSVKSRNRG